jgi:hypothetical protein
MSPMRFELEELVVEFYEEAVTYGNESFNQIKRRVLKSRPWPTKTFAKEARKMFDLARVYPDEKDCN